MQIYTNMQTKLIFREKELFSDPLIPVGVNMLYTYTALLYRDSRDIMFINSLFTVRFTTVPLKVFSDIFTISLLKIGYFQRLC